MGLCIGDAALLPAPVGQGVHDVANVPVLVPLLLQQLDPHVRHGHRQTVVEPATTLRRGTAQGGHPGHVLGDSDLRIEIHHDQA